MCKPDALGKWGTFLKSVPCTQAFSPSDWGGRQIWEDNAMWQYIIPRLRNVLFFLQRILLALSEDLELTSSFLCIIIILLYIHSHWVSVRPIYFTSKKRSLRLFVNLSQSLRLAIFLASSLFKKSSIEFQNLVWRIRLYYYYQYHHHHYYYHYLEAVMMVPDILLVNRQHRKQHVEQVPWNNLTRVDYDNM